MFVLYVPPVHDAIFSGCADFLSKSRNINVTLIGVVSV